MLPAPQASNLVLDAVRDAAGFLYHLWPTKLAEKHALRRARVQPCRAGQRPMRALAPEVRAFLDSGRLRPKYLFCRLPKQGDFCRRILKSIPQRLRPSFAYGFTARLNPCPSFDEFSASCKTRALSRYTTDTSSRWTSDCLAAIAAPITPASTPN
jgi:hypothetical protein